MKKIKSKDKIRSTPEQIKTFCNRHTDAKTNKTIFDLF